MRSFHVDRVLDLIRHFFVSHLSFFHVSDRIRIDTIDIFGNSNTSAIETRTN
jgi:hypothetical protein